MILKFFEWVKKMGLPYDPKLNVKKSASGWEGDPGSMIKTKKNEAKNYRGEVEYNSWDTWLKALKKTYPNITLDGNKDIAQAFSNGKGCGEWDGVVGTIVGNTGPSGRDEPRRFKVGNRTVPVTHVWRTHPRLPGSARFTFIFRVCQLVSVEGETATVRMVGLASCPLKKVLASELIPLPPKGVPLPWRMDA